MLEDIAESVIDQVHEDYDQYAGNITDIQTPNIALEQGMRDAIDEAIAGLDEVNYDDLAGELIGPLIADGSLDSETLEQLAGEDRGDQSLLCYIASAVTQRKCYDMADCGE
jgi:hypothetical protein